MNMLKLGKSKGQMSNITGLGYSLMILGVILGLALVVLAEFKNTETIFNDSADANATIGDVIDVYDDVVGWLPIIVIVIVVSIVLGLLGFGFGRKQ